MAIFGKADWGLPVITQIAQVNPDDRDELIHLLAVLQWQESSGSGAEGGATVDDYQSIALTTLIHFPERNAHRLPNSDPDDPFYSPPFAAIEAVADVARLAQSVLNTFMETHTVTVGQQRRMVELDRKPYSRFVPQNEGIPDNALVEFGHVIRFETTNYHLDLWRRFARQFHDLMMMLPQSCLRRCEECRNIFPVFDRKRGRVFCSHRCAARNGERRRYAARKEVAEIRRKAKQNLARA